jgi:hypothetical protein
VRDFRIGTTASDKQERVIEGPLNPETSTALATKGSTNEDVVANLRGWRAGTG